MKLKNVKSGVRVELKQPCSNGGIPVGAKGTIIESNDSFPFVDWDQHGVYAVYHDRLRKVKECTK